MHQMAGVSGNIRVIHSQCFLLIGSLWCTKNKELTHRNINCNKGLFVFVCFVFRTWQRHQNIVSDGETYNILIAGLISLGADSLAGVTLYETRFGHTFKGVQRVLRGSRLFCFFLRETPLALASGTLGR